MLIAFPNILGKAINMHIEERINKLEIRCRVQRFGLFALGLSLLATILLGMTNAKPTDLTASSLSIINNEGKPTIMLGSEGFTILDENGVPRIAMGINAKDKSVGLAFLDKNSQPRIALGTQENGSAGITLIGGGIVEALSGNSWPSKDKK